MPSVNEATKAAKPPPAKRDTTRPFCSLDLIKYPKKGKTGLTIPGPWVNYCLEWMPHLRASGSVLFLSVISAKEIVNPPSFQNQTFATEMKYPSKEALCLHVLLGVSLFISEAGSWLDLHRRA